MIDFIRKIKKDEMKQKVLTSIVVIIFLLFGVCWFEQDGGIHKAELIITVTTIGVCIALLIILSLNRIAFHKYVFIFVLLMGVLSVFVQPIFNIPDEAAHFARAEIISEGQIVTKPNKKEYTTIESYKDLMQDLKKPYTQSEIKGQKIDYDAFYIDHVAASNVSYLYIPQAIGITLAKILHLNAIWLLWLGRLLNVLTYSLLVSCAVKLAPKLKMFLFFVATLPMSIQQAASFSPDAIINGLSILLIGLFLYLYLMEERKISWKEIGMFFAIGVLLTIAKVTDIFLVGLILLIPKEKFPTIKSSYLSKFLIILGVIIAGGCYYYYTTKFPASMEHQIYFRETNVNSAEQIRYILNDVMSWLRTFIRFLFYKVEVYANMLNCFGWLEYDIPALTVVELFMFGKICFQEDGAYINKFNKFLVILMAGGIYAVSCLALYISWTPVGNYEVLGMQGRYLIPAIALVGLIFSSEKKEERRVEDYVPNVAVCSIMIGIMLVVTAVKFY